MHAKIGDCNLEILYADLVSLTTKAKSRAQVWEVKRNDANMR